MPALMADIRLVIQTDEIVRDALKLAAARRRMEMSELADLILKDALAEELEEIQNPPPRPVGRKPAKHSRD